MDIILVHEQMKISVIVITYNRKELLKNCLKSLVNQNFDKEDYEVIVIDDGGNDGTKTLVKDFQRKFPNVRYYYQINKGYGAARNNGLSKARHELVAFTDDDCIVEKDWLKKIDYCFYKFPTASAIGGSVINPYNTNLAWASYILNFSSWLPIGKIRKIRDIPTVNIAYKRMHIKNQKFSEKYHPGVAHYRLL